MKNKTMQTVGVVRESELYSKKSFINNARKYINIDKDGLCAKRTKELWLPFVRYIA